MMSFETIIIISVIMICIVLYIMHLSIKEIDSKLFESNKVTTLKNHKPPKFSGYEINTFASITKCTNCNLTGLSLDLSFSSPCPRCGHKVKLDGAGKWTTVDNIRQWVKPEIKTN